MSKNKRLIKKKRNATWRQKFQYELGKNRELVKKNAEYEKAVSQTNMLVDAVLIQAAMKYGYKTEDGYKMELPKVNATDLVARFKLNTIKEDDNMILTVVEK